MANIVYILTNPVMPGLVKVGRTDGPIETRLRQLDTTSVPVPFECFYAVEVLNAVEVEAAIHEAFEDRRVRARREFFRLSPDQPKAILKLVKLREVTPGADIVETEDDQRALDRERSRRTNFRFSQVGLKSGDTLHSLFNEQVTCTVVDDRTVLFRGEATSLSNAALIMAHESGRQWKAVQGPGYWKFEGRTLSELREEVEDAAD